MNNQLHNEYKDVMFQVEQVLMFTDVVIADEAMKKVFIKIGQATLNKDEIGVTIQQITDLVKINRPVMQSDKTFKDEYTNIDRRHAERVVNNLLFMTLCYYRGVGASKVINYTKRGFQVAAEIKKRIKGEKPNV